MVRQYRVQLSVPVTSDGNRYIVIRRRYGLRTRLYAGGKPRPGGSGKADHTNDDSRDKRQKQAQDIFVCGYFRMFRNIE